MASLTVDFVGCANGISGGIKEVGGALPLSPCNGCGQDGCPGIFIMPLSLCGMRIFNDGIAFDNRRCDKQDARAQLVWNALSKCWDGMKGRHNSSTESSMGRRVTSMKTLNLNNFLSCRLSSRRPTQCHLVPLLCRPSPCHPLPSLCHPLPLSCLPLPCHPLPYHPPLSCHTTVFHVTAPLLCWLVVALPCLLLLQRLSCASWLLNCRLSCRVATSLVAQLPLSSRCLSLFTLSLSYCAVPLSLRLSCASDLTSAPAALVYCLSIL